MSQHHHHTAVSSFMGIPVEGRVQVRFECACHDEDHESITQGFPRACEDDHCREIIHEKINKLRSTLTGRGIKCSNFNTLVQLPDEPAPIQISMTNQ